MTVLAIYFTAVPELNLADWIMYIGVSAPAMALFVMQLIWPDKFAYAWANWYFSFLAFFFDTAFVIMQTILILQLKSEIGEGQIRFRVSEEGNPVGPHLVSDAHLSATSAEFVHRGLQALPKRYFDIMALYHDGATEFEWKNGDATVTTSSDMLTAYLVLDWFGYLLLGYFTLINYSHFRAALKWADYTNGKFALSM